MQEYTLYIVWISYKYGYQMSISDLWNNLTKISNNIWIYSTINFIFNGFYDSHGKYGHDTMTKANELATS